MRIVHLLALTLALLPIGCSWPSGGTYPQAGFSDDEAAIGDEVWARTDERESSYSRYDDRGETRHIVAIEGDRVKLNRGEVLSRARVVVPSRLRAGDVLLNMRIQDESCGKLLRLASVEMPNVTVLCDQKPVTVDSNTVDLVTTEYTAHRRRITGWLVLFGSGAIMPWTWLRVARRRARKLGADADRASSRARGDLGQQAQGLKALTCPACGGGVQLVDAEQTTCAYCQAQVEIPAAYVAFARASAAFREIARQHAAALRRFEQFTHPVVPITACLGAAGLFTFIAQTESSASETIGIARMPLLALAIGLTFSALILAGAHIELGKRKASLVAPRHGSRGFACRSCGADLGTLTDGVGSCSYCGTQSLVLTRVAEGEKRLRDASADGARTIAHIVAETQLYVVDGLEPVIDWVSPACAFFGLITVVALLVT